VREESLDAALAKWLAAVRAASYGYLPASRKLDMIIFLTHGG